MAKQLKLMVLPLTLKLDAYHVYFSGRFRRNGPQQWVGVVKVNENKLRYVYRCRRYELIPTNTSSLLLWVQECLYYCQVDEGQTSRQIPKWLRLHFSRSDWNRCSCSYYYGCQVREMWLLMHQLVHWVLHQDYSTVAHSSLVKIQLYCRYFTVWKCNYPAC